MLTQHIFASLFCSACRAPFIWRATPVEAAYLLGRITREAANDDGPRAA